MMRSVLLALILFPVLGCAARAERAPFDLQGWFGLELFEDMNCANNPVWIETKPGSDRLDLRWRKVVTYADGTATDEQAFRIIAVTAGDLRAIRVHDRVPVLFRFAPDLLSFDYFEGDAIDSPADPDVLVTFVRCEFQGS